MALKITAEYLSDIDILYGNKEEDKLWNRWYSKYGDNTKYHNKQLWKKNSKLDMDSELRNVIIENILLIYDLSIS